MLAATHLRTEISDANATLYDFTSTTTTIDRPVVAGVLIADTNPAGVPALTKTGVTLVHQANIEFDVAGTRRTIFLFLGTPTSTSTSQPRVTATEAVSGCGLTMAELTGHDAASLVVGVPVAAAGSGTAIAVTLPALGSVDNGAVAVMAVDVDGTFTSDFAILGQAQSPSASPVQCIASVFKLNDNTVTATGPSGLWGVVAIEVKAAAGVTVNLGLITETDSAQAISRSKDLALGLIPESDTPQALAVTGSVDLGLVAETDSPQVLSLTKALSLGLVSESDSAQALEMTEAVDLGLAAETDTVQVLSGLVKERSIGLVSSTETAQALSFAKNVDLGLVNETGTAMSFSTAKTFGVGLATETESVQALTMAVIPLGLGTTHVRENPVHLLVASVRGNPSVVGERTDTVVGARSGQGRMEVA